MRKICGFDARIQKHWNTGKWELAVGCCKYPMELIKRVMKAKLKYEGQPEGKLKYKYLHPRGLKNYSDGLTVGPKGVTRGDSFDVNVLYRNGHYDAGGYWRDGLWNNEHTTWKRWDSIADEILKVTGIDVRPK